MRDLPQPSVQNLNLQQGLPVADSRTWYIGTFIAILMIVIFIESLALVNMNAGVSDVSVNKNLQIQVEVGKANATATEKLHECEKKLIKLETELNHTGTKQCPQASSPEQSSAIEQNFFYDYKKCIAENTTDTLELKRLNDEIQQMRDKIAKDDAIVQRCHDFQKMHKDEKPNTKECQCMKDCKAWKEYGANNNGIYLVNPDNGDPFMVYCDMKTDNGGWTVFQRRKDGSVDFYRDWSNYKEGFGDLMGEYWLGLEKIHRLTGEEKQLRIDLEDFENNYRYAKYSSFKLGNEATKYTLSLGGYSGDAGDTLVEHQEPGDGSKFTTKDSDNDAADNSNCATIYKGGWWYYKCHGANLNGLYLAGTHSSYADGVEWTTWTGYYYSLRFTEMKLK